MRYVMRGDVVLAPGELRVVANRRNSEPVAQGQDSSCNTILAIHVLSSNPRRATLLSHKEPRGNTIAALARQYKKY